MTAAARAINTTIGDVGEWQQLGNVAADVRDVLILRAEVRAYLWSIGELELQEAVSILQYAAVRSGLTAQIGQDAVQQILADAFKQYRE